MRAISPDRGPPQRERDYASDTRLGNRARVSKPIEITDRGVFVCHQRKENIYPAYDSLHDVMRTIWNDPPFRTQSGESMGALGKFEVVLGTLLSM